MSSSSSYAPKVSAEVLYYEHAAYAGNAAGDILYGMVVILYFECAAAILKPPANRRRGRRWGLLAYTTFLFALGSIYTCCNLRVRQLSYIDNREFPGKTPSLPPGPIGYTLLSQSKPTAMLSNTSFTVANWMADGLLMYRLHLIYDRQSLVLVLPAFMYLASLSMGTMTLYKTSRPDSSLFSGITVSFGLPYFTISVALNVLLTLLIAGRLFLHDHNFRKAVGSPSRLSSVYRSIVAILIESSALYAAVSICFIIPYAMSHHASAIFLSMLSRVQIIAPLLIIRRVANQQTMVASATAPGKSAVHSTVRFEDTGETSIHDYPLTPIGDAKHDRVNLTTTVEFVHDVDGRKALRYGQKV